MQHNGRLEIVSTIWGFSAFCLRQIQTCIFVCSSKKFHLRTKLHINALKPKGWPAIVLSSLKYVTPWRQLGPNFLQMKAATELSCRRPARQVSKKAWFLAYHSAAKQKRCFLATSKTGRDCVRKDTQTLQGSKPAFAVHWCTANHNLGKSTCDTAVDPTKILEPLRLAHCHHRGPHHQQQG